LLAGVIIRKRFHQLLECHHAGIVSQENCGVKC
jgi:hypothetical protein